MIPVITTAFQTQDKSICYSVSTTVEKSIDSFSKKSLVLGNYGINIQKILAVCPRMAVRCGTVSKNGTERVNFC